MRNPTAIKSITCLTQVLLKEAITRRNSRHQSYYWSLVFPCRMDVPIPTITTKENKQSLETAWLFSKSFFTGTVAGEYSQAPDMCLTSEQNQGLTRKASSSSPENLVAFEKEAAEHPFCTQRIMEDRGSKEKNYMFSDTPKNWSQSVRTDGSTEPFQRHVKLYFVSSFTRKVYCPLKEEEQPTYEVQLPVTKTRAPSPVSLHCAHSAHDLLPSHTLIQSLSPSALSLQETIVPAVLKITSFN